VDAFQHLGLGTTLVKQLIEIAKLEKIKEIEAYILEENEGMLKICNHLGFEMAPTNDPYIIRVVKKIEHE
jgi:acetyltransferase